MFEWAWGSDQANFQYFFYNSFQIGPPPRANLLFFNVKPNGHAQWYTSVILAILETEVEGALEPNSLKPQHL